ncbi:hypothetical protein ACMFMF_006889 [Clarireedia jacksonii]
MPLPFRGSNRVSRFLNRAAGQVNRSLPRRAAHQYPNPDDLRRLQNPWFAQQVRIQLNSNDNEVADELPPAELLNADDNRPHVRVNNLGTPQPRFAFLARIEEDGTRVLRTTASNHSALNDYDTDRVIRERHGSSTIGYNNPPGQHANLAYVEEDGTLVTHDNPPHHHAAYFENDSGSNDTQIGQYSYLAAIQADGTRVLRNGFGDTQLNGFLVSRNNVSNYQQPSVEDGDDTDTDNAITSGGQ